MFSVSDEKANAPLNTKEKQRKRKEKVVKSTADLEFEKHCTFKPSLSHAPAAKTIARRGKIVRGAVKSRSECVTVLSKGGIMISLPTHTRMHNPMHTTLYR